MPEPGARHRGGTREAGLLEIRGTELAGTLCAGLVARTEIICAKCPRAFLLTFNARDKRVAVRFQGLVKSDFTI